MIRIEYSTRHPVDVARDQIASQVAAFVAAGGVIQEFPFGASAINEKPAYNGRISKRTPAAGQTDAAHQSFQRNAAEKRKAHANKVRECAESGMSISATADVVNLCRPTVAKIAAEHGIQFRSAPCPT